MLARLLCISDTQIKCNMGIYVPGIKFSIFARYMKRKASSSTRIASRIISNFMTARAGLYKNKLFDFLHMLQVAWRMQSHFFRAKMRDIQRERVEQKTLAAGWDEVHGKIFLSSILRRLALWFSKYEFDEFSATMP